MGKHSILRVNLGLGPLKSYHLRKMKSGTLRVSTHIYGVSKEINEKPCSFLEETYACGAPPIECLGETSPLLRSFNTHLWGFHEDRWENIHFESKPRHVTP